MTQRIHLLSILALVACATFLLPAPAEACCGCTWTQLAEKESGSFNKTIASYYYRDTAQVCDDGDTSDTDYILVFRLPYNCDPDSLRFYSDSWTIRPLLPGTLKIFTPVTSDDDVHMCIGQDRVEGTFWTPGIGTSNFNQIYMHTK